MQLWPEFKSRDCAAVSRHTGRECGDLGVHRTPRFIGECSFDDDIHAIRTWRAECVSLQINSIKCEFDLGVDTNAAVLTFSSKFKVDSELLAAGFFAGTKPNHDRDSSLFANTQCGVPNARRNCPGTVGSSIGGKSATGTDDREAACQAAGPGVLEHDCMFFSTRCSL